MKPISKTEYDLKCPTRQLLELMSDKWVPGLIYTLSHGPQRPGALTRKLQGISKKMLTQTLRNLEDWGVVHRKVFEVVPPRVEYSLTKTGESFVEPIALLHDWARANKADVAAVFGRRLKQRDQATASK